MSPKKIAIFQLDMQVGGIQKSLLSLLQSSILDDYEVDVYLFEDSHFYNIDNIKDNIHIYTLKSFPSLFKFVPFRIIYALCKNKIKKEYDVSIDFNSYSQECAFYACKVKSKHKIMWIHNDVEIKLKGEWKYKVLWKAFHKKFSYFDEFVAVSEGIISGFVNSSGITDKKITVIPNIVNAEEIIEKAQEEIDIVLDEKKYNLVSVGALKYQKGFDLLLADFKQVINRRRDIHLYIIGEGSYREKIECMIAELELEEYVTLLGRKNNPYKYMKHMDGFVLASRYEGQGIVFVESKCLGLEIIMPKHLEKYNVDIAGCNDMVERLCKVQKREKCIDDLEKYNNYITQQYRNLLSR